ncbi:MAG: hypothetical protein ABIG31_06190 [Candidatus Omnitrophota bacterium]
MKKVRILIFVFVLTILLPSLCFCDRYVNSSEPIQVNDVIYFEDDVLSVSGADTLSAVNGPAASSVVSIRFIYLGVEDNKIILKRIDHQWPAKPGKEDRERIINLSLKKNQALLKVKPPNDRLTSTKLIITVVDDSYGIRVEEAD